MITYTKHHQPKSISLAHVTQYIETLIDVSEQESKRLYIYAQEELRTNRTSQEVSIDTLKLASIQNPMNPAFHGVLKDEKQETQIGWKLSLSTKYYQAQILPSRCTSESHHGKVFWNDDGGIDTFQWLGLPHFRISYPYCFLYPTVTKLNEHDTPLYQIHLYTFNEITHSEGIRNLHNDQYPATFLVRGSPQKKIIATSYARFDNNRTFWDIYDTRDEETKKILLRDWLPLSK